MELLLYYFPALLQPSSNDPSPEDFGTGSGLGFDLGASAATAAWRVFSWRA
ncbi:MAG: hypothetical protein Q7U56_13110 [Humidesulfovibrio sp.]|nr:hypothetical protein [Humidesulfovibrio sp.]